MARILVADDEAGICLVLGGILGRAGHEVEAVRGGEDALRLLAENRYDLLLVDLVMAGLDGLELIEKAKALLADTAVIILTGHPSLISAIRALRHEVDDYLVKPAGVDEIRQAVSRVLERRRGRQERDAAFRRLAHGIQQLLGDAPPDSREDRRRLGESIRTGPLTLDLDAHRAEWHGQILELTPTEFRLLAVLAEQAGGVIPAQRLVEAVHQYHCTVTEARELIKPHILHLRGKLEPDPGNPRFLLTVRGVGYCLRLER